MTTAPTNVPTSLHAPALRAAPSAPASGGPAFALDPIKLLNKYKWLLGGAAIVGFSLGLAAHFALAIFYPTYRASALFNCLPPVTRIGGDDVNIVSETEMLRFMQTQAKMMTSDAVLNAVVEDPALKRDAPKWTKRFEEPNGVDINRIKALEELKDSIRAGVVSQTSLIELSASYTDRFDASALVTLVRTKYMLLLQDQGRTAREERTRSIRDQLTRIDAEISTLTQRRENLIRTESVAAVDERSDSARVELGQVTEELIRYQQQLDTSRKSRDQMEAELSRPGGVTAFGDDMVAEIGRDPRVLDLQSERHRYENLLQSMLNQQYGEEHRAVRDVRSRILAVEQNMNDLRQRLLRERFDGMLEATRKQIQQFEAVESSLVEKRARLQQRLNDMTRVQSQLADIGESIKAQMDQKAKAAEELQRLISLSDLAQANRVMLAQAERPPTVWSFPRLEIMLPAGFMLVVGLVGGVVVLRELIDQRVKGPSDITLMPRMRLVGWVPDAGEDPAGTGAAETAFRDRPRGIVAESFREVRASLRKRLQGVEARTLLVMSGMPGSGATSTIANLALALAATDQKVLVIDANFRRAGQHRVFGVSEGPGLADVLHKGSGGRDMAGVVQKTTTPSLDVLPAGTKDLRVFERLSTDPMGEVLAWARANYDLVLVDVAPAIVGGDWISLAQRCDAVMLVVRAYSEKRGLINRIRNELGEAKSEFVGVLVNAVRAAAGGYLKGNIRAAQEYVDAA